MDYKEAALYIRVSTGKQEELSPDAQKRLGLEYAKKNKLLIRPEHIFMENGISGREAKKRPEFQKMISLAKSKPAPFQLILVWKFSRFARNQEESIVYKSLLKKQCGIEVVSISEPLVDGPFGSLIERIIEWMDEYYSIRLSGEVTRGMTEKALRGGYQSTPPLGYDAVGDGKPFVINEEDFKSVEFIFRKTHDEHMKPTEIARLLNDMGKRTRRGTLFEKRNISYVLRNKFYIGKVKWNDIEYDGTHEVRITPEYFQEVQAYLDSIYRPKIRSVGVCKHWLSGLLKCSICGSSLAFNSRGKGGTQFFNCWKYAKGHHRGSSSISMKKAEAAVIEFLENILNGADFIFTYKPQTISTDNNELEEYKKELSKLELRETRIKLAYENGVDTLDEYKENKTRLKQERERLENLIANFETTVELPSKDQILEKAHTILDVIKDENISYEVKGNLMRSIVDEIIFDRATETFTFRLYSK